MVCVSSWALIIMPLHIIRVKMIPKGKINLYCLHGRKKGFDRVPTIWKIKISKF